MSLTRPEPVSPVILVKLLDADVAELPAAVALAAADVALVDAAEAEFAAAVAELDADVADVDAAAA